MFTTMFILISIIAFTMIGIKDRKQKKADLRMIKNAQKSTLHLSIINQKIKELESFYILNNTINTSRNETQLILMDQEFTQNAFQMQNLN